MNKKSKKKSDEVASNKSLAGLMGDSSRRSRKKKAKKDSSISLAEFALIPLGGDELSDEKTKTSDKSDKSVKVTRDMLTGEQDTALDQMEMFLKSNNRQMLLGGYAGTGKTTIIRMLLDYANEHDIEVACTAPTNEAVRVIAKSTGRRSFTATIYSLLGLRLVQEDDRPAKLAAVGESKLADHELVVIDESSMINTDLFNIIQEQLAQFSHLKIIYVGDPAQLPPVKDPAGATVSPVFKLDRNSWAILKEVQRCTDNNPIIQMVTAIRENIKSPHDVFEHVSQYNEESGVGIKFINSKPKEIKDGFVNRTVYVNDEFMEMMFSDFDNDEFKEDTNFVRALAYTNHRVDELNTKIRKHLYGNDVASFIPDEVLLVDEPIMHRGQWGDEGIAYTVGERLVIHSVELAEDDDYGLKYWKMRVENYEAPYKQRTKMTIQVVHKNFVEEKNIIQSRLAAEAKEKVKYVKNKGIAWREFFAFKNRFSSVKYIYATTVHKAQGSTFKNVYVDDRDMNILRWSHTERNKLKYVAFTRASHKLVISD